MHVSIHRGFQPQLARNVPITLGMDRAIEAARDGPGTRVGKLGGDGAEGDRLPVLTLTPIPMLFMFASTNS